MGGVVRPLCEPQRGQALFEGVILEALDGRTSTQNCTEAPQICDPRRADSKNRHPGTPPDPSCLWNNHTRSPRRQIYQSPVAHLGSICLPLQSSC